MALDPTLRIDDQAAVEKFVRHAPCLIPQPAGIVAQVEHEPLNPPVIRLLELGHRFLDIVAGAVLEGSDSDIGVAILEVLGFDGLNLDHLAGDGDGEQVRDAIAMDGEVNLAATRSAHQLDRVGQRHPLGEVVVDLDDLVAGLDTSLVGRSPFYRLDHGANVLFDRDSITESAETPTSFD